MNTKTPVLWGVLGLLSLAAAGCNDEAAKSSKNFSQQDAGGGPPAGGGVPVPPAVTTAGGNADTLDGLDGVFYQNAANLTGAINPGVLPTDLLRTTSALDATRLTGAIPAGSLPANVLTNASLIPDTSLSANIPRLNGTNNFTGPANFTGAVNFTGATVTGLAAGGALATNNLTLTGTTTLNGPVNVQGGQRISLGATGTGAPTVADGDKLVLFDGGTAAASYKLGINGNELWMNSNGAMNFYRQGVRKLSLNTALATFDTGVAVTGNLDVSGTVLVGFQTVTQLYTLTQSPNTCPSFPNGVCFFGSTQAACPVGFVATGGGVNTAPQVGTGAVGNVIVMTSYPLNSRTWQCSSAAASGAAQHMCFANCARLGD